MGKSLFKQPICRNRNVLTESNCLINELKIVSLIVMSVAGTSVLMNFWKYFHLNIQCDILIYL